MQFIVLLSAQRSMLPAVKQKDSHALPWQACVLDRMHSDAATVWRFYNLGVGTNPSVHELL